MKQFRKSLAVLLSVLMLCTALPLSALVSAADVSYDGYFYNGDFEAGESNWTLHTTETDIMTVVDDPTSSGQGMVMQTNAPTSCGGNVHMFQQAINMTANTDYTLKFKVYCYADSTAKAAFWVTLGDTSITYNTSDVVGVEAATVDSSSSTRVRLNVYTNVGTWIDVEIPFNSGDNASSTAIIFSNYRADAGYYYFDDITLIGPDDGGDSGDDGTEGGDESELTDAPEGYNMLTNGDFELGDEYWTKLVDTIEVVDDPTGAGQSKVMQTNETASQTHMFQQGVSMSASTDYILSFKVYTYAASSTSPGFWVTLGDTSVTYSTSSVTCSPMEVKTVDSSSSTRVRFTCVATTAYNTWITVTIPFNSGNNTAPNIIFSNYRADAGQYYFDDVTLVRADGKMEPEAEDGGDDDETDNPDASDVEGNLIVNGTFETGDTTGWNKYQSSTVNSEAALTGSYGAYLQGVGSYGSLLQQTVDVVIGKNYTVKLWLKAVQVGVNVQVVDGGADGTTVGSKWCSAANYGEWTLVSIVVSPTTNSLCLNICGAGTGSAEIAYVDDVSITVAPLISNGDFESGDLSSWEKWQSTTISTDAAYEGSYGANIIGNGSWGGLLNQSLPVTDGKSYELSFWYKINTNGFTLQLIGVQSGTKYLNKSYTSPVGEWTQLTTTVTAAGDSAIKLNFSGIGGSSAADATKAENVYIDSITFVEKKSASYDGYIYNGDFEIGAIAPWTTYYDTKISAESAYSGDYGLEMIGSGNWGGLAYQDFTTEVGKTYTVTMWAKAVANGVNINIKDVSTDTVLSTSWFTTTAWTQKTFEVTATGTKTRINFNGGGNNLATTVYVDDIQVICLQDPSFDGYLYNGDFEAGSLTKWNVPYGSSALSASAAYTGIYGVSVKGPGDWGGLLNQTFTLEAGKTYTLSFWYLPVTNGVNYKLKDADGNTLDSFYLDSRKVAQWTYYEVTFESGYSTTATISFGGSGTGDTDEVYVDDIRVVNLSGNEMDRVQALENAGASIRDTEDGNPALAFRFDLSADGIEVTNGNVYTAGTGTLKLYTYADVIGNIQRFGAVVTNNATIGADADAFKLDNVNNGTVLDVNAKYLCDLEDNSVGYAVRIINIPWDKVGTDIYARPYYVYELDGEEVTIYGDIISNNYSYVEATRRTKRVLTIGEDNIYDSIDTYLYDVLKSADYDQVILGNLCPEDGDTYTYYKNDDNGVWTTTTDVDAATAIADERWQYIVVNDVELLDWVNENKPTDAQVLYHIGWEGEFADNAATAQSAGTDSVIPAGTALENLATIDMQDLYTDDTYLSDRGEYAVSLAWFITLTGESLDLVTYIPEVVGADEYDMARAAAHAWYNPYEIDDLTEVVLFAGSDFQPDTWAKGVTTLQTLTGSLMNQGYGMFDGLLFVGDYTQALGSDYDSGTEGMNVLDEEISKNVNFDKIYSQGNHDHADLEMLNPYGNNDPDNAPYGVFVINEDNYNAYGGGGQQVAADLTAYCNEKLASDWGNKPIFVLSHLPLHYNYRTMKDKGALTASYIIDALNAASDAGLNIIYLIAHNHSGGYDDYLGGAAIYIPKGDSILVPDASNYANAPIETELRFTYMNAGYTAYYVNTGNGADTALTMSTFRIQANGDVIITRYDASGVHNLKSAGKVSPNDAEYTSYTYDDERVYTSSRIVGANKDEEYVEN